MDEEQSEAPEGAETEQSRYEEEYEGEREEKEEKEEKDEKEEKGVTKSSKTSSFGSPSKTNLGLKQQPLFLVEFLVDTVTIDSCSVDEEVLEGQTCVSLTFLNFPPMEICEKDFDPNKETSPEKVRFDCGKSLMFAFNEKQCERPPPLIVEITVSKKLGEGNNTWKVDIGTIKICVADLFHQIVDIAKFKPDKLPASKSIKDCFMLIGPGKRTMGEVSVYIRLSCLGQNVVTEFQCSPDMKSGPVLFKNREGKKVFQFSSTETQDAENKMASARGKTGCGCLQQNPVINRGGQGDATRIQSNAFDKTNKSMTNVPDKNNRHQSGNKIKMTNKSGDYRVPQHSKSKAKEGLTVTQENTDPDQNVFVLRVGDKGQIPDRGKMILEFRTPKQKIIPKIIPPYHEDIAIQTDSQKKGKGKKKKRK